MENFDSSQLLKLAKYRMPFGKYEGTLLIDLPEPYVVWFSGKGFPKGELGTMLSIVYEVKLNGLEHLFDPIREKPRVKEGDKKPKHKRITFD